MFCNPTTIPCCAVRCPCSAGHRRRYRSDSCILECGGNHDCVYIASNAECFTRMHLMRIISTHTHTLTCTRRNYTKKMLMLVLPHKIPPRTTVRRGWCKKKTGFVVTEWTYILHRSLNHQIMNAPGFFIWCVLRLPPLLLLLLALMPPSNIIILANTQTNTNECERTHKTNRRAPYKNTGRRNSIC